MNLLYKHINSRVDISEEDCEIAFVGACKSGSLELVKLLSMDKKFDVTAPSFVMACTYDKFNIAKFSW